MEIPPLVEVGACYLCMAEGVEETMLCGPKGGNRVAGFGVALIEKGLDGEVEALACESERG
jgi:hypothetical protein